jgi:serine/threonine protein kinase
MEKNILKISNNTVNFKFIFYYSEISILFLISQIIKGLFCMHEHNIIHSDLKPQNILIFNNFNIKITDFSISTSINKSKNTFLHIGTLNYSCFECINGITLSINATKVDFFSLGITILEIIMKKTLNYKKDDLSSKKDIDQFSKIITNALNELINLNLLLGNYYSKELIILIQGLLNPDPNERFGFKEIVNSKWINNNYEVMNHIYKINVYENELKLFIELQKNSKLLNIKNSYRRKYCINF